MTISGSSTLLVNRAVAFAVASSPNQNQTYYWRDDELKILSENLGKMSEEKIADLLPGRSAGAVKIMRQRKGMKASTKTPGYLTANLASKKLGMKDPRPVIWWVKTGLVIGHRLDSVRTIWMVNENSLKRFVVSPQNWPYFDVDDVADEGLRHLISMEKVRWGDEWLSTREAADLRGVDPKSILTYITRGRIPAVRVPNRDGRHQNPKWANWYVKRSDVENLTIYHRGSMKTCWTDEADSFLVLASAAGLSPERIAHLMSFSKELPRLRLMQLQKEGKLEAVINENWRDRVKLKRRLLLADWRRFRSRFPYLDRAARRYKARQAAGDDLVILLYMLRHQCAASGIKGYKAGGKPSEKKVKALLVTLKENGIHSYL